MESSLSRISPHMKVALSSTPSRAPLNNLWMVEGTLMSEQLGHRKIKPEVDRVELQTWDRVAQAPGQFFLKTIEH